MPRSSTSSLSQETISELESQFFNFLDSLNPDEKKKFFSEFLTNEEKMMMYKRLALYWCLLEGYPLSKIQQMIGVTHDTTRVYNKKKNMLSEEFKSLMKRISINTTSQAPIEASEQITEQTTEQSVEQLEPTQELEAPHEEFEQEFVKPEDLPPVEEVTFETQQSQSEEGMETHPVEETFQSINEHIQQTQPEETHSMQEPEIHTENKEEENISMPIMHSFDESDAPQVPSASTQEPAQSQEQSIPDQEKPQEEKKKGWGKFFGF